MAFSEQEKEMVLKGNNQSHHREGRTTSLDSENIFYHNELNEAGRRSHAGRGPKGWRRSDEIIKEDVSEALYRDRFIDASDIEVDVREGVVFLKGFVDNRSTKRAVEYSVENIPGVEDVQNEIRLRSTF